MPAQLLSLEEGPNILLDKPIVLIGRHEECDIQLNSRKVSRKHCCVAQVADHFVIRDLGSTNGVRINGVRVQEGMLRPGDELTIGNHRYQIQGEPSPVAVRPPGTDEKTAAPHAQGDDLESADDPVPLPDDPAIRAPRGLKPTDLHRAVPPVARPSEAPPVPPSSLHLPTLPPRG